MPVIKDVPLSADLCHASVVVRTVVHRLIRLFIRINMQITVADDHTSISKLPVRIPAHRVTELMHHNRRIDEVIIFPTLSNGGRLKKLMAFISASGAVRLAGHQHLRRLFHGQHIFAEHGYHRTGSGPVPDAAEAQV